MTFPKLLVLSLLLPAVASIAKSQTSEKAAVTTPASPQPDLAKMLGISFPGDSSSKVLLTQGGKQYLIDTASRSVQELHSGAEVSAAPVGDKDKQPAAALFAKNCAGCHGADGQGIKAVGTPNFTDPSFQKSVGASEIHAAIEKGKGGIMPAWSGKLTEGDISSLAAYVRSFAPDSSKVATNSKTQPPAGSGQSHSKSNIYQPGDDVLMSLPTGKPTDRHGVYVDFAHRFPYDSAAFTGPERGAQLFGLDNVAIPSFGVRYGVTDNLSVSVFRAPTLINRPIQLMAGYNLLEERKGNPLNLMVRVSIEGQDNFRKNYTENIEGVLSRSITSRAQFYVVPTISFNDRRLVQPSGFLSQNIADVPGVNAFSLGAGLSVDIRPTVALMAEVIPTLVNAHELGIFRPVFSFGIQKKIYRHAFTLGFSTSPGTTVSQRAATRAQFLNEPSADTLGGLTIGFDLTRQIH